MPERSQSIDKPLTINLNFLGTSHHRDTSHNIITRFHEVMAKEAENNPQIISRLFDGPGSAPSTDNNHPIPGTYIYDQTNDKKIPVTTHISREIDNAIKRLTGTLVGDGVENLLFEAILFIDKHLKGRDQENITINLHGFSRGADACMRMANILDKLYPNISVNLFLIDQVPGPTKLDDPNSYTVPANVKRFDSILMLHEYLPGFDSQHEDRYVFANPEITKVSIKHYFGYHSCGIKIREGQEKRSHTTKLVYDDMYQFCKDTGSLPIEATLPAYAVKNSQPKSLLDVNEEDKQGLSPQKRFELYCEMKQNEAEYSKGPKLNTRYILKKYQSSKESALFVNQEHKQLLQERYPALFTWFFEDNDNKSVSEDEMIQQLDALPLSFAAGFKRYVNYEVNQPIPKPSGVKNSAESVLGTPLITNELTRLTYALRSTVNYYHFHHDQKDSINDRAEDIIRQTLDNVATMPDEKAIRYLKQSIEALKPFFVRYSKYSDNFMAQRINSIVCDPSAYAYVVLKNINSHLSAFKIAKCLDDKVAETITKVCEQIKQTVISDSADDDKYFEIRAHIRRLSDDIRPIITGQVAKLIKTDSNVLGTLNLFPQRLNELSQPFLAKTTMAKRSIERLNVYIERNNFWGAVQAIFKTIHIPFPARFTPEKHQIALQLKYDLNKLDQEGLGNDMGQLNRLFKVTQDHLSLLYKRDDIGLRIGTLDKIINHTIGKLNFFTSIQTPSSLVHAKVASEHVEAANSHHS